MLALARRSLPVPGAAGGSVFPAQGMRRGRVALLQGCAQQVLAPRINQAAINVLTRHGIEVVLVKDEQCCGALTHHLGRDGDALARARSNIAVWLKEADGDGLDAILVTTSGCGRSEEHTSELQSQSNLVCRLLLEKKNNPPVRPHAEPRGHDSPL